MATISSSDNSCSALRSPDAGLEASVITCPNCAKENQDHYKFCLGCGSKLPQTAGPPAPTATGPAPTPPPGYPAPAPPPGFPAQVAANPAYPPHGPAPSPAAATGGAPPGFPHPPSAPAAHPTGTYSPPVLTPPSVGPATGGPPGVPFGAAVAAPAPPPGNVTAPQPIVPSAMGPAAPSGPTVNAPPIAPTNTDQAPCLSCGFRSPVGFAFCGRCGTKLAAPDAAAPNQIAEMGSAQTIFVGDAKDLGLAQTGAAPIVAPPPAGPPQHSSPTAPTGIPPLAAVEPPRPAIPTTQAAVRLVMLGPDGQPLGERVLAPGELLEVGRDAGPPWDDDAYLDPAHALLHPGDDGVHVEDRNSLNGVFVKLQGRHELASGDQFRVGQELLIYEELPEPTPTPDGTEKMGSPNPGYWGRVSILVDPTMASAAFPIAGDGIMIGRENGDVTFPQDGYVSGRHCRVAGDDSGIYLEDLGSSNGTYLRARSGQLLPFGSLVLIGQKLFQLERA